jgi:hypothetical protein
MNSNTVEIEMLSLPSPSAVVPDAAREAAGRIGAIAASVSIVACERAAAALKCRSGQHSGPEDAQDISYDQDGLPVRGRAS